MPLLKLARLRLPSLSQADTTARLTLARISTGAAVLRSLHTAPPAHLFNEFGSYAPSGRRVSVAEVRTLKGVTAASTFLWMCGVGPRSLGFVGAASGALLGRQIRTGLPGFASYTTHLNVFAAACALSETAGGLRDILHPRGAAAPRERCIPPSPTSRDAAILLFLQLYLMAAYSQSGLAKLLRNSKDWTGDATTVQHAMAVLGTPLGQAVSRNRLLVRAAGAGTLLFELGALPVLLLRWDKRRHLALAALAFHGSIRACMGISFWHLSYLHLSVFILPTDLPREGIRRLLPGQP